MLCSIDELRKLASRAWKRNWGNLSPASENKLLNSGVWNPDNEGLGMQKKLMGLSGKYKDLYNYGKDTSIRINDSYNGNDPHTTPPLYVSPLKDANIYTDKNYSHPELNNNPGHHLHPDSTFRVNYNFNPSNAANDAKFFDKRYGKHVPLNRDNTDVMNSLTGLHEIYEAEEARNSPEHKAIMDRAGEFIRRRNAESDRLLPINSFLRPLKHITEAAGFQIFNRDNLCKDKRVFSHFSPKVLAKESEDVRFVNPAIRQYFDIMRGKGLADKRSQPAEAEYMKEITGDEYGKSLTGKSKLDPNFKQVYDNKYSNWKYGPGVPWLTKIKRFIDSFRQ